MKSLLHKTLSQFLVCTVAIFILTTPLFFLLTKYFYAEDMIDIIEAVQLGTSIPHIDLERDIVVGMMLQFLLIFLVLSLALFIMMRFITHRLWLPFDDTLQKTEQFNLAQSAVPQFQKTEIKEFARLNKTKGTGESACLAYCKFHNNVLASSNLKDTKEYCRTENITYFTTLDFLWYAKKNKVMTEKECNDFIQTVISKNSILPNISITIYTPTINFL